MTTFKPGTKASWSGEKGSISLWCDTGARRK